MVSTLILCQTIYTQSQDAFPLTVKHSRCSTSEGANAFPGYDEGLCPICRQPDNAPFSCLLRTSERAMKCCEDYHSELN